MANLGFDRSIGLARAGRFSPRQDDPSAVPSAEFQLLVTAKLARDFAIEGPVTARDVGLLWRMIGVESLDWACRGIGDETSPSGLPVALITREILRRGSERAVIESLVRLSMASCHLGDVPAGPVVVSSTIEGPRTSRTLRWSLAPGLLSALRDTSLEGRRVAPFARLELKVALRARNKWTAPIYSRLVVEAIRHRRQADRDGWSSVTLELLPLARAIRWPGRNDRMQDFWHQVVGPCLAELNDPAGAAPLRLRLDPEVPSASKRQAKTVRIKLQRISRAGQPLDVTKKTIDLQRPLDLAEQRQPVDTRRELGATMRMAGGKRQGFATSSNRNL